MARKTFSKVMWVGRMAATAFGLALVLALVFGVATTAIGATGGNFILGKANSATTVSKLTASIAGPALTLVNQSMEAAATALNISVASGKAPLKVNAAAGTATNLSADELDGEDSAAYQRRVSGQCDAGSSIQTIGADGAVTCETDDGGGKAPDSELLDGKDSTEFLGGQLVDTRQGNLGDAPNNSTGYINVISNYTPPVDATAASFVRCAYDGNTAGQILTIRGAMRSPSGSGGVTEGNSFYLPTTTPGANVSVLNQNSDTFELTANQSYDFGVTTGNNATPSNGLNRDYCTATVMVFRR